MPAHPFVIHVARLRHSVGSTQHEQRLGVFDPDNLLRPSSPVESTVPEGAEAECDVVLEPFIEGIVVRGTVRAPWSGVCGRCTAPVGGMLNVEVKERYVDAAAAEGDDEAYPIEGDELDLMPLVHDAVLLELPLVPLCREDCRGLCPWCGSDRNEGDCDCVAPVDPRWASLNVLRAPR